MSTKFRMRITTHVMYQLNPSVYGSHKLQKELSGWRESATRRIPKNLGLPHAGAVEVHTMHPRMLLIIRPTPRSWNGSQVYARKQSAQKWSHESQAKALCEFTLRIPTNTRIGSMSSSPQNAMKRASDAKYPK